MPLFHNKNYIWQTGEDDDDEDPVHLLLREKLRYVHASDWIRALRSQGFEAVM